MSTVAPSSADARAAWDQFCASAQRAGTALLAADHLSLDELDRTEGLRFIGRLTRGALHGLDPSDDPTRPVFTAFGPPAVSYGIPNPDNLYQRCSISPELEYRITGRRNTIHFVGFGAQAPGRAAQPGTAAHLDQSRLELGADGTFEIAVSSEHRPGNWIELTPEARAIMVRQTYLRRQDEVPADLHIECLTPPPDPVPLRWDQVTRRLAGAATQLETLAGFWPAWVGGFADEAAVNEFFAFDEATHLGLGGDPQVRTPLLRWQLEPDEALAISIRPPDCTYWNVQLASIWTEPIDSLHGPSCLNASEVTAEADGSCRVVVAHADPGCPNWLDTGGHHQGTMSVRWVNADALPIPATEVVPFASLRGDQPWSPPTN
jgi:hypothetical protein